MSRIASAFLVLGDQLFSFQQTPLKKGDQVLMIEDFSLCTHYKYHKNKILFFLSSMREYRDFLEKKGIEVTYYDAGHKLFKKKFEDKLKDFFEKNPDAKTMGHYEIADHFFNKKILGFAQAQKLELESHANPMFLTPKENFQDYLANSKKPLMKTFYYEQRRRLNVLLDKKGEPEGGHWSFDTENRKKCPKRIEIPEPLNFKVTPHRKDVEEVIEKYFSKHPGTTQNFWLPTKESEAKKVLHRFLDEKFKNFGPYEDAIKSDDVFGFHSTVSPMLNNGLITPGEMVQLTLKKGKANKVPIQSIEGFLRQVIGWREFVKGIYDNYNDKMEKDNFWKHKRQMKDSWYKGSTGLPPLDDSIKKAQDYGYTHHIERLMILSNLMLLCEIDPKQVHQWFMEMFVDSSDWVMAANVYGMGQMSEGGIFSTKPYICGSNYIIKMSDYKKDDWCHIMDGLYWRFIEKHKIFFQKNPRMSMMTKMLEKIPVERKKKIFKVANQFIKTNTSK